MADTKPPDDEQAAKARAATALAQLLNGLLEQNPFTPKREEDKRR